MADDILPVRVRIVSEDGTVVKARVEDADCPGRIIPAVGVKVKLHAGKLNRARIKLNLSRVDAVVDNPRYVVVIGGRKHVVDHITFADGSTYTYSDTKGETDEAV